MIGEKIDRLFLEKDCPHCGLIRAELDIRAASSDEFRGKAGQKLLVFSSLSNEGSIEMLERFGFAGMYIPILQCHDGSVLVNPDEILSYLRKNGMTVLLK